jgi:HEAT repeat protein
MKGCCFFLLLLFVVSRTAVLAQPAAPAPRNQVLLHLEDIYGAPGKQNAAFQSIKAMGTNAIPLLIEILGYQTTQADQWYEKAYAKAPPSIQSKMSKPEALEKLREEATLLLRNMRDTHLYLTNMVPLLQDSRPEVRRSAAYLVQGHAYRAQNTQLLDFISGLKDSEPDVRHNIALAYANSRSELLPRAKSALEAALNDPDENTRMFLASALLKADKRHEAATSTLKSLFASTNTNTRYMAAVHYLASDPQSLGSNSEVLQILISTLSLNDVGLQSAAAHTLGNLGSQAKPAIPELQKLLQAPGGYVRAAATNALQRIAPEVLPPVKP